MTSAVVQAIRTRQQVRELKGQKPIRKLRKPPAPLSTRNMERRYRGGLARVRERLIEAIRETLLPRLPQLEREAVVRADQLNLDIEPWADAVRRLMGDIRTGVGAELLAEYNRLAGGAFDETSIQNLKSIRKQFRDVLQVDVFVSDPGLQQTAQSFIEENVSLVKGVDDELLKNIEGAVFRGFRGGRRAGDIATEIERLTDISRRRARLIANDQVQKINGQLTRTRQLGLGVGKYIWRSSLDERVRKEHRRREGRVFSWDEPPEDGHPGEPINCRCFAEPYLEDVLGEASDPPPPRLP